MVLLGHINAVEDYDLDAQLPKINSDPRKFKLSIGLALIEHVSIIALAIMLFISFNPYNLILGGVWTTARAGEGFLQIYNEFNFSKLLNIAEQQSNASDIEKNSFSELGRSIIQAIGSRFAFAMILWSIGTFSLSILLIIYELGDIVPPILAWIGIVASVIVGFYYGIKLVRPNYEGILALGGLLAILFEILIGCWLFLFGFFLS